MLLDVYKNILNIKYIITILYENKNIILHHLKTKIKKNNQSLNLLLILKY